MTTRVFIGLGSNLGDRLGFLNRAIKSLLPEVSPLRSSHVYQTPPWGFTDQPQFLNQVVEAQTDLEPEELLKKLKQIERKLGRIETIRYGPRCIDLDILFYGNAIIQSESLIIPHPLLAERTFVLVPMNELSPNFIHPQLMTKISDLLQELDFSDIEQYQQ